jgi:hypothetical protein
MHPYRKGDNFNPFMASRSVKIVTQDYNLTLYAQRAIVYWNSGILYPEGTNYHEIESFTGFLS